MNEELPANPKSLRSPFVRRLRWVVIALLLYTVFGFFVAPAIIKSQLIKRLPGLTHRQAAVRQVKANPYSLSLTIRELSLMETNGEPFAAFDEFYSRFSLSSIVRRAWTFSEIKLTHSTVNIVRAPDGTFNFANLVANQPVPAGTKQAKPLPMVLLQHLFVTNAVVTFTDRTRAEPFRAEYGPIKLELTDLTTRRDKDGPYSLIAATRDGESFSWSGTVSVNPPRSAGKFDLLNIPVRKYAPYLAEYTRAEITNGILNIGAAYRIDAGASALKLDVTNANFKLAKFQINAPGTNEMLLALADLDVSNASASLTAHEARAPLVKLHSGSVLARREADGQLNWLKLLIPQTNTMATVTTKAKNAPAAPTSWNAFVDEIALDDFAFTVEDRVPATPAQLRLDDFQVSMKGISNQSNAPVSAVIGFKWHAGGSARIEANGALLPPSASVKLAITNLALAPFQPYIQEQVRLVLNSGNLSVNGEALYSPNLTNAPIRFAGDVSIGKLSTIDTVAYHEFLKWDDLSVLGIQAVLGPNQFNVNEVKFTGSETSLVVSTNHELNLLALLKKDSSNPTNAAGAGTAKTEAFSIKVGTLAFERSSFRVVDQSLTPRFQTSVEELNGSIRDVAFPGLNKATVDIRGKVTDLAPFEIAGSVTPDPKNLFLDLKLAFKNGDLTPFSPYAEKFAGYPLNKGKLTFDLHYDIENGKLKAENIVAIDQLTFGARNNSPDATKLPVKLGVALLKDRNGRIDLNLPVSGSLDDPKFNIADLVWKAVVNILVKVATSPFSLLGAMFGGGEELQYADFAPGRATLEGAQTNKLVTLTKALSERPELNLEISASVDVAADREALTRKKLEDTIKSSRIQELVARGETALAETEFKLEGEDYDRLLRKEYERLFPNALVSPTPEPSTSAPIATNAPISTRPTVPVANRSIEIKKGSTQLMRGYAQVRPLPDRTESRPASSSPAPTAPTSENQPAGDEMEQRLLTASPASDDDLRELMQQRSEAVQKFLLSSGKVTAERLFLVAPKPIDPAAKGLPRASFSLN